MDLSKIDPTTGRGPSAGLACHLCSGVAATEAIKILLGRGPIRPGPVVFSSSTPIVSRLSKGRLHWGNSNPWQRFKRRMIRDRLVKLGWSLPAPEAS
jgi:hypothetical protein